jgi:phage gp46-like protein
MDFKILLNAQYPSGGLTFTKNSDIRTDIFNSINIKKGYFFQNKEFGSDLYKIRKLTSPNVLLAKQYIEAALEWLLSTGRAKSLNVIVERDTSDVSRLNIKVEAQQPDGLMIIYEQFKRVV